MRICGGPDLRPAFLCRAASLGIHRPGTTVRAYIVRDTSPGNRHPGRTVRESLSGPHCPGIIVWGTLSEIHRPGTIFRAYIVQKLSFGPYCPGARLRQAAVPRGRGLPVSESTAAYVADGRWRSVFLRIPSPGRTGKRIGGPEQEGPPIFADEVGFLFAGYCQ